MKFLYPEFLWAFTALAIPILIHLFNFKRYKTLYFSSLNFVKQVDQETKSTQRLKHLLILIARLLAFIFLVLAFAQPYFDRGVDLEQQENTVISLFIDNSFSMQAKGVEGELLSEARESARAVIENSPVGTQYILGTNEMSGIEQRKLTKVEALEKLDKIDYSPLSHSLDEIVEWQAEAAAKGDASLVQSIIYSDFQKTSATSSDTLNLSNFDFYPIQLIPERTENVFIDSVWFDTPIRRVDYSNELSIRLSNDGDVDLKNIEVTVNVGDFNKSFYVDLPANQQTTTSITYTDKVKGFKTGRVTVVDDNVLFDDAFYFTYEVKTQARVLVINGEDAIENVGVALDLEDYYQVNEVAITAVTLDDLAQQDLVMLNGANALSSGMQNYLINFKENGGALALFPGTSPVLHEWDKLLGVLQLPRLGQQVTTGTKIDHLNDEDVFIQGILTASSKKLNLPGVRKAFQPVAYGTSNYRPLITMQNGLPLLVYSNSGSMTFMLYSAIHPDWGSLATDALFPSMILRMGELSQRIQPIALTIGEKTSYPVYVERESDQAIHLSNASIDFISSTEVKSGVTYLSLAHFNENQSLIAGNYSIDNDSKLGNVAINYSRTESKLDYLSETEITDLLTQKGAINISFKAMDGVSTPFEAIQINKPFSYWKICIILTLIFVLIEMVLVRFLKK